MGWIYALSALVAWAVYGICMMVIKRRKMCAIKHLLLHIDMKYVLLVPLRFLCFAITAYCLLVLFHAELQEGLLPFRNTSILLGVVWIAYRWKKNFFQIHTMLTSSMGFLDKMLSVFLAMLFLFMTLRIFHVDIVPLLTFGGIGAAALGLAAKDVLGNLLGGGMLSAGSAFKKGDTVFLPDRNFEGVIEEMGWYLTVIRDKDKRPVYFPNSLFSQMPVMNLSRISHRRIYQEVQVPYEHADKIMKVTQLLRGELSHFTEIDLQAPFLIYWSQIDNYAYKVTIDLYVTVLEMEKYVLLREKVLQDIVRCFQQEQVEFSCPVFSLLQKGSP